MMTEDPQVLATQFKFTKADDFKSFYVNWIQVGSTPFDVFMVIGQAINADTHYDVEQNARLVFHPAEAKVIAALLHQTVQKYEEQFGVIPDPVANAVARGPVRKEKTEGD
jgi:hypothetical protein